MNPTVQQPNKEQLEALAFRILREIDGLQNRLSGVKQLIAQIENAEFVKNVQAAGQPNITQTNVEGDNVINGAEVTPEVDSKPE